MTAIIFVGIGGLLLIGVGMWFFMQDWEMTGTFVVVLGIIGVILFCIVLGCWISAGNQARVIAKLYNIEVSQEDMFWSGDTIKNYYIGPIERQENKITADVKIEGLR